MSTSYSLVFLLLHSELLVVVLFFLFISIAITFSLSYLIGLGFCYLILGGMELALNLLIVIL